MRVVMYARLSKDDSGEAENVEIQLAECTDYAEEQGWEIVGIFKDNDMSAYSDRFRPDYADLLAFIRDNGADCIVVTEMTRLNRKLWNSIDLFRLAETTTLCRIESTDGSVYDLSTKAGIHTAISAAMDAEKESMKTSARQKRKKQVRAKQGHPNGGMRPYGYDRILAVYDGKGRNARQIAPPKLVVREDEAKIIRDVMVKRVLTGVGLKSIAIALNADGITTSTGKAWAATQIRDVLTMRTIAGIRPHNGNEYPATWEPILEKETFDRVQLALSAEDRFVGAKRRGGRTYLLTGLTFCGKCGCAMSGQGRADERRYGCLGPDPNHKRAPYHLGRLAEPIELLIREAVIDQLDSPEFQKVLTDASAPEMRTLLDTYTAQKLKLDDLVADYATGLLNREQFAQAKSIVDDAMEATRTKMNRLQSGNALAAIAPGQTVRQAWEANGIEWRRTLVRMLISRITIMPGYPGAHRWPADHSELRAMIGRHWNFNPAHVQIEWIR